MNSVTSRDVAKAANVSQALVSRAFSGKGRISATTRDHILKVAAEIGWQPNALAASMVTGDAPLVAVVTTRLSFDWRAQVMHRLLQAFEAWHLKPILFHVEDDREVDRLLGETISWRTRGVVVTAGDVSPARAEAILSRGQFLAALNRPANHPGGFSIATDNPNGGATAARLFLNEGRRRFLVLAGPEDSWASTTRTLGFASALRESGHDEPLVWHNQAMSVASGGACAAEYLALPIDRRPDAVFSTNDAMAIGFLDGLRASGVTIPDDLSLIGFDNLAATSWPPYRLSTFEQPLDTMVASVVAHIEAHRQGQATPAPTACRRDDDGVFYCPPRLIPRATTRALS